MITARKQQVLNLPYQVLALFLVCFLYAILGSPTPDSFGLNEAVIGGFLVLSIGITQSIYALTKIDKQEFWVDTGQAFLAYGLIVSTLNGALQGQNLWVMLRDIIPFLYLFLPLLFMPMIRKNSQFLYVLAGGVVYIGLCFSLRSLYYFEELLYLENMPTVLLSCLLLIGGGITLFVRGENKVTAIVLILLSLLPLMAMIESLQRASLGAVCLYVLAVSAYMFWLKPQKAFIPILGILLVSYWIFLSYSPHLTLFFEKNDKVGLNMRPQEFLAVWDILSADPYHFLFGTGWGGTFHSPAVANLRVNFTHNFFSSILLKTGVCGLILASAYILGLLERLVRVIIKNPVLGLAILAPVLIDLLLYASFKSLDFGLVLLMIPACLIYLRNSESSQVPVKTL